MVWWRRLVERSMERYVGLRIKVKVDVFLAYGQDMERPVGRGKRVSGKSETWKDPKVEVSMF